MVVVIVCVCTCSFPIHIVWCCWLNGIAQFAMNIWKLCFMMWNKWPQIAATEEAVAKVYLDLDQFMGISERQSAFNCKNVIISIRLAFCRYMPQHNARLLRIVSLPLSACGFWLVCHPLWPPLGCNLTFSLIIALSFSFIMFATFKCIHGLMNMHRLRKRNTGKSDLVASNDFRVVIMNNGLKSYAIIRCIFLGAANGCAARFICCSKCIERNDEKRLA